VFLISDSVGFRNQFAKTVVDLPRISQQKFMYVITWRNGLNPGESTIRSRFSKYEVSPQEIIPNHDRGKAHASLKGNTGFARNDGYRPIAFNSSKQMSKKCEG